MRKGVALLIVMGAIVVISTLALASLYFTTQQSRITEHKIKRIRALAAAHAGIIHALEGLRRGDDTDPDIDAIVDSMPNVNDHQVDLEIGDFIDNNTIPLINGTRPIDSTVDY